MKYLITSNYDGKSIVITGTTEKDILLKTINWLVDKGDIQARDFIEILVDDDFISFTPDVENIETI